MTIPYAAWVEWLAAFERGEDRPMLHLQPIDAAAAPSMTGRLLNRIAAAVTARAGLWSAALDRRIAASSGDFELGAVLVGARTGLLPLYALADSPLLPPEMRTELRRALTEMVEKTQRNLEDSARRQLGAEDLLAVLRDHRLTTAPRPVPPARPATGRTVII